MLRFHLDLVLRLFLVVSILLTSLPPTVVLAGPRPQGVRQADPGTPTPAATETAPPVETETSPPAPALEVIPRNNSPNSSDWDTVTHLFSNK